MSSPAAASAHSSIPFIDVPKLVHKWLIQLAAEQKTAEEQQRIVSHSSPAKLITRELMKRGMSAHTSVSKAIAKLREDQHRLGDTPELAIALQELPSQWSTYNILLQEAAAPYFRQNGLNTPNFTVLYFEQITFLTVWNEIWRRHFHIASGGNELKLLHDIQNELLSAPDMNKQQREDASKSRMNVSLGMFNFSQTDMESITATAKRVAEKQHAEEEKIADDLAMGMERNYEFFNWLTGIYTMVADVVQVEKNKDTFIVENAETAPIRDIKSQLWEFIGKLRLLTTNVLESEATHVKMRDHAKTLIEQKWPLFQEALNKPEWQEAYRTYILAYTEWSKALKMIELFNAMNSRAEETEFADVIPCPEQLIEVIPTEINNEFVAKLKKNMEDAREAFSDAELTVRQYGLARDKARYSSIIEERLRMCARLPNRRPFLEFLDEIVKDMDNKIDVDSRQNFATGEDVGCRALLAMRAKKADIRKELYARQSIANTYAREEEMKKAAETCIELEEFLADAVQSEQKQQQYVVNRAQLVQRSPQTLLTTELMKRPLMTTYAQQAKKTFESVFQRIMGLDILKDLTSFEMLPDNPSVALDPIETSLMLSYATDNQPSTFGEIIRYAMWLMWVLHKDHLNTMERPLTTEASPTR